MAKNQQVRKSRLKDILPDELKHLCDGIRSKYENYNLKNEIDFPKIDFNSSHKPYDHLKKSFEVELTKHGVLEAVLKNYPIPGNSLFAQVFYKGIIPGPTTMDTLYMYVHGRSRSRFMRDYLQLTTADDEDSKLELHSLSDVSSFLIEHPVNGQMVPQYVLAEGKAPHPHSRVWLVVHPAGSFRYWVQPKVKVDDQRNWVGQVYIGSDDKRNIGIRFEIRAFVNPTLSLNEEDELLSWPEAQMSTEVTEVIRGF